MQQLTAKPVLLIFVAIYAVILVIVGAYYSRETKTSDEFVLAGKGLGSIVLIGTFLATYTGNGTISGGGNSLAYTYGLWPGIFFALPAIGGIIVLFLLSKKLRSSSSYTVAQLLENKYGRTARLLAGLIIALSMISICAYQYKGLAFILNVTTGMDVNIATAVAAVLIIFLAFSGGLKSVAVTDAISAFIMLFGIIIATPLVIRAAGGWSNVIASSSPESLTLSGGQTFTGFISGYLPLFFLTMGDQNLYQRIAAGDGEKTVKKGFIGWFLGMLVVMPLVAFISFSAKVIFGDNIDPGMAFMSSTTVIPTLAGGILLAAAAAFIITTGDSYLLSGATNITYDIYAEKINPNATDAQKFKVTRWTIVIAGIAAYILLQFFPTVLAIQYWSYTIYGAGITPALIGALCWKKVTKTGGIASMIVGTIVTIVYEMTKQPLGLATVLVAVPVAVIVLIVVSFLTQKENQK